MLLNKWVRAGLSSGVILIAAAVIYFNFFQPTKPAPVIPITKLGQDIQLGNVRRIAVDGTRLTITYRDGVTATSNKAPGEGSLEKTLNNLSVAPERIAAVEIVYEHATQFGDILQILMAFLPLVFIGAILFFFLRRSQGGNNPAMSFGKSGARVFTGDQPSITFADVAGVDEAKLELQEVVEFL